MLNEAIRLLIQLRDENQAKIESILAAISSNRDKLPLSSEGIVTLISQHLACKHASRLPVLIIAAAYKSVEEKIGEKVLPLNSHNAADFQTASLGDIEICLVNDEAIVTAYEMKLKKVTTDDIDTAITKLSRSEYKIDNYLFITTDEIYPSVSDYAASFYEISGGTEIAILDCIGFIRSFLHLFHRNRMEFVDFYQDLVLSEPDSAVSQALKEAFLALRRVAEANE
ncbi:MAG: restriction endonuclease, SacI family [Candidatus Cloacimonetes bacterium]|nr:restriction endonuclease, SacI family [Candidatus Cloacimonadota bacterium]